MTPGIALKVYIKAIILLNERVYPHTRVNMEAEMDVCRNIEVYEDCCTTSFNDEPSPLASPLDLELEEVTVKHCQLSQLPQQNRK